MKYLIKQDYAVVILVLRTFYKYSGALERETERGEGLGQISAPV